MKSQDKEMGWQEPHTNGQILTVYYSSHGKGVGVKKWDAAVLSNSQ